MALSVAQILLAIGGGLGERRTNIKKEYRAERQRASDYWDANGSRISETMTKNSDLALASSRGLLDANLTPENLTEMLDKHGVNSVIELNNTVQKLRAEDPAKYNSFINEGLDSGGVNAGTGGLNSFTKLQESTEDDSAAWEKYIADQFSVKDMTPVEREDSKGFFKTITDRLTGQDMEDEHNRFMNEEYIGDKTIRQLKELRDRGPETGKTPISYDDLSRVMTSNFSTSAVNSATLRLQSIVEKTLKPTSDQFKGQIQRPDGASMASDTEQAIALRKGSMLEGEDFYFNPETFFDVLRAENEISQFQDADARVLGFNSVAELKEAIRPRKDKALEANIASGELTEEEVNEIDTSTMKEFNTLAEAQKYQNENKQFKGIVYIKNVHDILILTGGPIEEKDGPPGPGEGGDPAETGMLPDASTVVLNPAPSGDGSMKDKRAWNKDNFYDARGGQTQKYKRSGEAIVVPRRPTTEAEQTLLIKTFGFDSYVGTGLSGSANQKAPTLEQTQKEWDEKYKETHDVTGFPIGATFITGR